MNILLIKYGLGSGWLKVQTHICVGCAGCVWCQPTTFHYMFSSVYFDIFVYIEVESTHICDIVTGCGGLWLVDRNLLSSRLDLRCHLFLWPPVCDDHDNNCDDHDIYCDDHDNYNYRDDRDNVEE